MRAITVAWLRLGALGLVWAIVLACTSPRSPVVAARPDERGPSAPSAPSAPPARVRAAYTAISGPMLPAWIAQDEGLFQKHGLDVELSYIAGAVKVGEALLAGELDVGVAAAST